MMAAAQHLVILSGPRSGAHMLRSMLKADPGLRDIGAFLEPFEGLAERPATIDYRGVRAAYEAELAADPDRVVLSNLKIGPDRMEHVRAAADTGGRFLLLVRRDRLAQACSFVLALQYHCFWSAAPKGVTIAPDPAGIRDMVARLTLGMGMTRAMIATYPHAELAFEELAPETAAAVAEKLLGRPVVAGPPTTDRSSPPLEAYVTNLELLRRVVREPGRAD